MDESAQRELFQTKSLFVHRDEEQLPDAFSGFDAGDLSRLLFLPQMRWLRGELFKALHYELFVISSSQIRQR